MPSNTPTQTANDVGGKRKWAVRMSRLTEHACCCCSLLPVRHVPVSRDVLSHTHSRSQTHECVMASRRRRTRDHHDQDDVDITSYDDVTRSSALLAYIQVSSADRQLGISVVGYQRPTGAGGLYISHVHSDSAANRDARLRPGDRLNSINGFRLSHLGNDDAFQLLRATVSRQLGSEHTVRLGIIRSHDVTVLRHWQQWSDDDTVTSLTTTTTTTTSRPTAVVQGCITPSDDFTTTRF